MFCLVAKQNLESVVSLHKEDASTLPIHYIPSLICYQLPSGILTVHLRGFSLHRQMQLRLLVKSQ